ncbi:MAG TPA: HAD-IA family hydrolase [Micromonosporaceae bacterium]|nr:HAD-IA family hydrolase [Micromonosporaceae bacterium]
MSRYDVELTAEALLFDLDGVLVDSAGSITRAWRRWAERRGVAWTALAPHVTGRHAVDTIRAVRPDLPDHQVRRDADEVNAEQVEDITGVVAIPGMVDVVSAATRAPWAVVTGCPRALALARLRACGYPLPPVLVTAEDVARGKPAPDGYLRAAAALGVAGERCVAIEDSASGVAAAQAAGAAVVMLLVRPVPAMSRAGTVTVADGRALSVTVDAGRVRLRCRTVPELPGPRLSGVEPPAAQPSGPGLPGPELPAGSAPSPAEPPGEAGPGAPRHA